MRTTAPKAITTERRQKIEAATAELCRGMEARGMTDAKLDLSAVPGLASSSILYFSAHVPECRGKRVHFEGGTGEVVRLRYAETADEKGDASIFCHFDKLHP